MIKLKFTDCGNPGIRWFRAVVRSLYASQRCNSHVLREKRFPTCEILQSERKHVTLPILVNKKHENLDRRCSERELCSDSSGCYYPHGGEVVQPFVPTKPENCTGKNKCTLFSIIVTCYEADSVFLEESLSSVKNQAFRDWEAIIVDDGSIARSCERAAIGFIRRNNLEKKMRVLYIENGWLANARNRGIANAVGSYILPLDSDDYLYPHFLYNAAAQLASIPEIELLFADQIYFGKRALVPRWVLWENISIDNARLSGPLPVTTIFAKNLWEAVRGYSDDMIYGNEDYSFWLAILKLNPRMVKLSGLSSWYRLKDGAMHDTDDYKRMALPMLRVHHPDLYDHGQIRKDLATIFCSISYKHSDRLQKAVERQPFSCAGWLWLTFTRIGKDSLDSLASLLETGLRSCEHNNHMKYMQAVTTWLRESQHQLNITFDRLECASATSENVSCKQCEEAFLNYVIPI